MPKQATLLLALSCWMHLMCPCALAFPSAPWHHPLPCEAIAGEADVGGPTTPAPFLWHPPVLQHFAELDGARGPICEPQLRVVECDECGNIIRETLKGDLTGRGETEEYSKELSYNASNQNVEETDGFYLTVYGYQEGTDLLLKRLTYSVTPVKQLVKREFFHYSESGQLIEEIEDDGAGEDAEDLRGVTYRKITRTTWRTLPSGQERLKTQSRCYWDPSSQLECPLTQVAYEYDDRGLPMKEHLYDADGELRRSLERAYDRSGRIVRETDALGHVYQHVYDARGNRIQSAGPDGLYTTTCTYDRHNRLLSVSICDQSGERTTRSRRYGQRGDLLADIDEYGNETTYACDAHGRQTHVRFPLVTTPEYDKVHPTLERRYDAFGHLVCETNAAGETVRKHYTAHGHVSLIVHPDGLEERFTYTRAGHLLSHEDRTGLITEYERDGLGRELARRLRSPQGKVFSVVKTSYQGERVTRIVNEEGETTRFTYDGAGRLTEVARGDQVVRTSFDALGRKAKICEGNGSQGDRVRRLTYDAMDRVIEECVEDLEGTAVQRTLYTYDPLGRCIEKADATGDTRRVAKAMAYDYLSRTSQITDQSGRVLRVVYDTTANALGQRVTCMRLIDPLKRKTEITYDALGRPVSKEVLNAEDKRIDLQEWTYDLVGNVRLHRQEIHRRDGAPRIVLHRWSYGPMGRLVTLEEGVGDPRQRVTRYAYDACGRLASCTRPSGETLHYSYDFLGRIKRLRGSVVDHRFTYDKCGRLVKAIDQENRETLRTYNAAGALIHEVLANGLSLSMERDGLNRCTKLSLPDGSSIVYAYNAAHLQRISRLDRSGATRYSHVYSHRDGGGRTLREELPFGLGVVSHRFGPEEHSIISPFHECRILEEGFDAMGNVLRLRLQSAFGAYTCGYSYDDLDQLASESGVATHEFVIDSRGDRVWQDSRNLRTDALGCVPEFGEDLLFDADGRLSERHRPSHITRYRYDDLDRLVEVQLPGMRFLYSYDPFHRRVSKSQYVKDGNNWSLTRKAYYIYFEDEEIGAALNEKKIIELRVPGESGSVAIELGSKVYVPLQDFASNVLHLVSESGEVVESYRYTAFGREVKGSSLGNPWRFAGQRLDEESGFVLFGRRHYWVGVAYGRFISPDPCGYAHGPSLYAFRDNNPIGRSELSNQLANWAQMSYGGFLPWLGLNVPLRWQGETVTVDVPCADVPCAIPGFRLGSVSTRLK